MLTFQALIQSTGCFSDNNSCTSICNVLYIVTLQHCMSDRCSKKYKKKTSLCSGCTWWLLVPTCKINNYFIFLKATLVFIGSEDWSNSNFS